VPGRANRLLSKFADGVSAAYPSALESMRGRSQQVLPNPLLAEIFMAEREDGIDAFGLDPDRPVIFVMGGSQGAEALNRAVFEAAQKVQQTFPKEYCPQLLWATGPRNFDEWSAKVGGHDGLESVLKLHPFIRSIEAAWACADLAIVRGGAGTLAELAATGTPGLVVPYPFARDLHQHKNAAPYEEAGAIRVIDESGLSSDLLARQITELFTQPRKLLKMSLAAGGLAPVGAADQMADWVLQVLQQRTGATVRFEKPSSPSKPVPPRLPGSTNVAHATPS
jgi:UDP-N-acetylglucosamine--N-acetylmuramyl-(pentapeptide) pyrophosphoryl-undecaprenol N-acetylglucosamine transferase